jgi:hypothetical protein
MRMSQERPQIPTEHTRLHLQLLQPLGAWLSALGSLTAKEFVVLQEGRGWMLKNRWLRTLLPIACRRSLAVSTSCSSLFCIFNRFQNVRDESVTKTRKCKDVLKSHSLLRIERYVPLRSVCPHIKQRLFP